MIGEVIAAGDDDGAADDVADGDWEKIVQEKINDSRCRDIMNGTGNYAGRDVEHVGDGVFETA